MALIKEIIENVEGVETKLYPVTSTKAVYNENNEKLDDILRRNMPINISTEYNNEHIAEVLTLSQSINKVASKDRTLGFQGKYLASDGWHTIIYTGDNITNWSDTTKWIDLSDKILRSISENATFAGVATPTTNPGTPNGPVFYIAGEGTYVNFNNITIDKGQLCILKWNNGSWSKELMTEVNSYASISGVLNLTSSTCISSLPSMKENELRLYIAGDSNGDYPAKNGDKYVKVNDSVKLLNFLNTDESLYVNVGDIIAVIGNKTVLGITNVCRVIPLNDAKAGLTDGIMTKSDKAALTRLSTNVVELLDIINTRLALKSYSESNLNNALESGVYPWCTLGRPANSTGTYTCIVQKSFDVDLGGYYTIEQTAYGRQDELGQVYKRIIFQKNDGSDTQYGEWIRIDSSTGGQSDDDIAEFEIQGRVAESFSGLQNQQIPYTVRITSITGSLYYENTDMCVNFGGFGESLIYYWQERKITFFSIRFSKTGLPVGEKGPELNQPVRYKLKIKGVYGEDCYIKDVIG